MDSQLIDFLPVKVRLHQRVPEGGNTACLIPPPLLPAGNSENLAMALAKSSPEV